VALAPFHGIPPMPYAPVGNPARARHRRQAIVCLVVVVAGWLGGMTTTPRGWLTIGLGCLVVMLLGAHRAAGRRWQTRMVTEYALVALLAVLLVTSGTVGESTQPKARKAKQSAEQSALGQTAEDLRQRVAVWWEWVQQHQQQGRG
jgi:hypothetical protein